MQELKQREEKLLNDIQTYKDENLKLKSEIEDKVLEIIALKKKIKLMRRDMQK